MPFHHKLFGEGQALLKAGASNVTSFIRENPLISGAAFGGSILAGLGGLTLLRRGRRKRKTTKRTTRRKRKKTRIKRRVKRRATPTRIRRRRRRIIRGRGLGTREIRHSGRGVRNTQMVSFRTKGGKIVRFKAKRRRR